MKNILFKISIFAILFSSCNMGKQYANYRFGGNSEKVSEKFREAKTVTIKNTVLKENLLPVVNEDTFELQITKNYNEKKNTTHTINIEEIKETSAQKMKSKSNSPVLNLLSFVPNLKSLATTTRNVDFLSTADEVLGWISAIAGLALITILVIVYLQSVNFAIIDVVLILGVIGIGILICIGIGKLFEGIMPGMSLKKSSMDWDRVGEIAMDVFCVTLLLFVVGLFLYALNFSVGSFFIVIIILGLIFLAALGIAKMVEAIMPGMSKMKNNLAKLKLRLFPKKSFKSYSGVSALAYFLIGLGVILAAIGIMALIGPSDLAWAIIMTALSIHLFFSLLVWAVEGIFS